MQEIKSAQQALQANPNDIKSFFALNMCQYFLSWGIRGDNSPRIACYLGYLDCKELYPDMTFTPFEEYVQEALDGKAEAVLMDY